MQFRNMYVFEKKIFNEHVGIMQALITKIIRSKLKSLDSTSLVRYYVQLETEVREYNITAKKKSDRARNKISLLTGKITYFTNWPF